MLGMCFMMRMGVYTRVYMHRACIHGCTIQHMHVSAGTNALHICKNRPIALGFDDESREIEFCNQINDLTNKFLFSESYSKVK